MLPFWQISNRVNETLNLPSTLQIFIKWAGKPQPQRNAETAKRLGE